MAGERFAGEGCATVPAGGNGKLRRGRDDDVRGVFLVSLGSPGGCGCGLFATLTIFGERFAGKDGGFRSSGGGLVVGGGVVYAVERSFRSEATGDAGLTVIAASTVAPIAAVVAIA